MRGTSGAARQRDSSFSLEQDVIKCFKETVEVKRPEGLCSGASQCRCSCKKNEVTSFFCFVGIFTPGIS